MKKRFTFIFFWVLLSCLNTMYWRIHLFHTDTLFSYTKFLHEYSMNIYFSIPSSAPFRDFSSHFNSTLFNYYTFIKYFDTWKTNFSTLFLLFRIFLKILTCLFFLSNIWFNLCTWKIICCFYRDQIKFRY